MTLYHLSPTYLPEATLRAQTKGGKAVQLPTYFVPGNGAATYINVTRPESGYYVTGTNSNPVREGEGGRDGEPVATASSAAAAAATAGGRAPQRHPPRTPHTHAYTYTLPTHTQTPPHH